MSTQVTNGQSALEKMLNISSHQRFCIRLGFYGHLMVTGRPLPENPAQMSRLLMPHRPKKVIKGFLSK